MGGPEAVCNLERSSWKTTSSTQCNRFSMLQWARTAAAKVFGLNLADAPLPELARKREIDTWKIVLGNIAKMVECGEKRLRVRCTIIDVTWMSC